MNGPKTGKTGEEADLKSMAGQPRNLVRHSSLFRLGFTVSMFAIFAGFLSLGTWQILRLQWKLDLIARVEQRVHAAPVPSPGISKWPQINASADEYRHVQVNGTFLHAKTVLVQASTELGGGFWVMTPLAIADQATVLVNRGFIPEKIAASYRKSSKRDDLTSTETTTITVSGLLRMTEPGGGFLRKNDPAGNRWYSRDVQAIAAATGMARPAPFFIDADADGANDKSNAQQNDGAANRPVAGLTVIHFHNNHLMYALVWFLLASMTAAAWAYIIRDRKNVRAASTGNTT